MKKLIVFLLMLPAVLLANDSVRSVSAERQSQDVSRAVRACMQKADQVQLMMLQMRAAVMAAEVSTLCAAGREKQAQSLARQRVRELEVDPLVRQIRQCSGLADQNIPPGTDFCSIDLQSLPVFR